MKFPVILSIIGIAIIVSLVLQFMSPHQINSDNFGINFAWMNNHDGTESTAWMGDKYNLDRINKDLDEIQSLGIKKIRVFIPIESVMTFDRTKFTWSEPEKTNLQNFTEACSARGLSVIVVMNSGNHDGKYNNLDGKFRWPLIKNQSGINAYLEAQKKYIELIDGHMVSMFELMNEPYGELTWSPGAKESGITKDEVHNFLKQSYDAAKKYTNTPAGFSDYEEEEQYKEPNNYYDYGIFSNKSNLKLYVDDCTDIYSMHIYRPNASYLYDFRSLIDKPKWLSEVGNLNYYDPEAKTWPMAGHNELWSMTEDFKAVKSITDEALNQGFSEIYVWSWSSNSAIVSHNPDGSHTLTDFGDRIRHQLIGGE
jgi:hypothetical protein